MADPLKIRIEAGGRTEELTQYVLEKLSNDQLDQIGVDREFERNAGTANEPITIGVILTIAIGTEAAVAGFKAAQAISEAIKSYIEYRTKKLEKEKSPQRDETMQVFVLSGDAPPEISGLHGTRLVKVEVRKDGH
jgi:hypothetical protein